MQPRDIVLESIYHRQPPCVPYTLAFEPEVETRLNAHYGGTGWKQRLVEYMVHVGAVDTDLKEQIDETHNRDAYGGIWRTDRLPWHLETPPLSNPTFDGYEFP